MNHALNIEIDRGLIDSVVHSRPAGGFPGYFFPPSARNEYAARVRGGRNRARRNAGA